MRSVLPMRAAKIGYIVMSAALCVLGILLICLPEVFSGLIGVLIGIILIVFGAVRMAGYFLRISTGWRSSTTSPRELSLSRLASSF